MNSLNCTIVISSCDVYSDTWKPFFYFFNKYWPDCPFEKWLITTLGLTSQEVWGYTKGTEIFGANCVDKGWANNMQAFLDTVKTDYILYMQEDYFLNRKVKNLEITVLSAIMERDAIKCLRLYPSPPPNYDYNYTTWLKQERHKSTLCGVIAPQAQYRVSLQAAIWNVKTLKSLLIPGETGWDMEIKGSVRAQDAGLFLSVYEPAISYVHPTGIKKGCWTRSAVDLCRVHALDIDFSKRPIVEV